MMFNIHGSFVFRTHLDFILLNCFSFLLRNPNTGAGKMAEPVQYLCHKLSWDPQHPYKKLRAMLYVCNQAAGQTETAQWLTQPSCIGEPQVQWESLSLKK